MARWLLLVSLMSLLTGCSEHASSRSSESQDGRPPVTVEIAADAESAADRARVDLSATVSDSIALVAEHVHLEPTVIHVEVEPEGAIAELGVGGFTDPETGEVHISLDPASSRFTWTLVTAMPVTIAHELHHSARILSGPGYGRTLSQAFVTEGLADAFSREAYPEATDATHPWTDILSDASACLWWQQAHGELESTSYDHAAWFFGSGRRIPLWTGYAVGAGLVDDYLSRHPDGTAAALVGVDAETVVDGSRFCA